MPVYSTGFSALPDIGELSYNGVKFSSLFHTQVNGVVVQDQSKRATKQVDWTLEAEGVVTLGADGADSIDATVANLNRRLSQPGGQLVYRGRGFRNLTVNAPGGAVKDVAWGPTPKVIYFRPLGQGRSAQVRWSVTFSLPEVAAVHAKRPVLQYNFGSVISYDEDGYSSFALRGTIEVPMTRFAAGDRIPPDTVADYRQAWLDVRADLTNYRVVRRNFEVSRDRRTIEWEFAVEELPWMGLPLGITNARGAMTVRPARFGGTAGAVGALTGVCWEVSLRATYVVRGDLQRRLATQAFYALLWFRMNCSSVGPPPLLNDPRNAPQQRRSANTPADQFRRQLQSMDVVGAFQIEVGKATRQAALGLYNQIFPRVAKIVQATPASIIPQHFGYTEGLYLDSKTVTFEAGWWLACRFVDLMAATGTWNQLEGTGGGNCWAASVEDVMGWKSWKECPLDKSADVIVDFGGP